MKVVLATDSLEPSGMGEHMLGLAGALGADVAPVLALPGAAGADRLSRRAAELGLPVKRFDPASERLGPWLRALSPDLVHVHAGIGWEGHALVRDAAGAGLAVIRTEHLPYLLTDPRQIGEHRDMLRLLARLVAVSEAAAESFRAAGVPAVGIATIRNGIVPAPAGVDRGETRAALGVAGDAALLLTVARLTPQKGHDVLLEAFRRLRGDAPSATLLLAGEGPERERLEGLAERLGIAPAVRFLGGRDDVPALLAAADLFVLPSLFEGLPLVLLEAMAARVPVAASRAAGSLEAVGEEHPFLAEIGDADGLFRAMRAALAERAAAERAAAALHRRFHQHFHLGRMGAETRALYDEVLAMHPTLFEVGAS